MVTPCALDVCANQVAATARMPQNAPILVCQGFSELFGALRGRSWPVRAGTVPHRPRPRKLPRKLDEKQGNLVKWWPAGKIQSLMRIEIPISEAKSAGASGLGLNEALEN